MEDLKKLSMGHRYTMLQCFYWIAGCALMGFAAVFLRSKGLSNTLVGLSVGGAAFVSIWLQPTLAEIIEKIKWLSIRRMILIILVFLATGFFILGQTELPPMVVVFGYLLLNTSFNSMTPLVTALGMEYMNLGYKVNFCISRGFGSVSYAITAVFLGQLVERFYPGILSVVFLFMAAALFAVLFFMGEAEAPAAKSKKERSKGVINILKSNRSLFLFVIGFGFSYMTCAIISTYTVNIVNALGGTNTTLGWALFVHASSEMPAMFLCNRLLKKVPCQKLLKISSFFFVIRPLVLLLAPNLPMAFVGFGLQSVSFGIFTPVSVYFVNQELKPKDRVVGQTIFGMVTVGAGSCIGNLLGGFITDNFGIKATLVFCVLLATLGFCITSRVKQEKQGKTMEA